MRCNVKNKLPWTRFCVNGVAVTFDRLSILIARYLDEKIVALYLLWIVAHSSEKCVETVTVSGQTD